MQNNDLKNGYNVEPLKCTSELVCVLYLLKHVNITHTSLNWFGLSRGMSEKHSRIHNIFTESGGMMGSGTGKDPRVGIRMKRRMQVCMFFMYATFVVDIFPHFPGKDA